MGLLETIAALTIMATSAAVLFPWVSQSLRALDRSRESEQRAIATMQSLRLVDGVDPAIEPIGSQQFDGYRVLWRFEPVGPQPILLTNTGGQFRSFAGQLYSGDVIIRKGQAEPWFDYPHQLVSYTRRVQSMVLP